MIRAVAMVLALALAGCDTTAKEAQLRTLVGLYLNHYGETFGAGLEPVAQDQIAPLAEGQAHMVQVELEPGLEYRFIGACDNECVDIDMQLVNLVSGEVVAFDNLPDNYPLVVYTPPEPGRYQVSLHMFGCTMQPCYAGLRMVAGALAGPANDAGAAAPAQP